MNLLVVNEICLIFHLQLDFNVLSMLKLTVRFATIFFDES